MRKKEIFEIIVAGSTWDTTDNEILACELARLIKAQGWMVEVIKKGDKKSC